MKIFDIDSLRTILLRVGLLGISALMSHTALACPKINSDPVHTIGDAPIPGSYGEKVFFCQQSFPTKALSYKFDESTLVTGGSQSISMGNTIQTSSLTNSIDLSGFSPNGLDINTNIGNLTLFFPSSGGYNNSPSLFNFYTKIAYASSCLSAPRGGDQFNLIKKYLRDNPNIFTLVGQTSAAQSVNSPGSDIVKFSSAELINKTNPSQKITADVILYHANQNLSNPTFETGFLLPKYCWFGVGARVEIKDTNLTNAGNYDLQLGVNVK